MSEVNDPRKCLKCMGSGQILQPFHFMNMVLQLPLQCNHCGGAGWTVVCLECQGKGSHMKVVLQHGWLPQQVQEKCSGCAGWGKLAAARQSPAKRKRVEHMTGTEMREELRKMKRKVSGTKAELQKRLEEVFEANDRGWLTRGAPALSKGAYLESGTFRDVYMVTYTKGPRKNMKGVYKVFKDQKAEVLIQEDLKAVEEAGRIIKAFNEYNDQCIGSSARRRVYLNQPEVWSLNGRPILVEPFIDGTYAKFNSNSGWVNEGYNMMQALSHFSFHVSNGQHLLCDLQGGGYDTHYILTDPAVLSLKQEFGATDGGKRMMKNFFAHHLCNEYCDPSWLCMERPKVVAPARSGTSFFPKAQRSTAMDAFRNAKFNRW